LNQLVAYIASLELEVDRLRKQDKYLRHVFGHEIDCVKDILRRTPLPHASSTTLHDAISELNSVIDDLNDSPSRHPAQDQVIAIALRPLIERAFRWQQRLTEARHAVLHLELSAESVNWFPVRFRHILDNLLSNALKFRDPGKGESRVVVQVDHHAERLVLRVSDNGQGMPAQGFENSSNYLDRSTYERTPGTAVGLSVVKLLIEQSGGSLYVESDEGKGSQFVAMLPRFDVGDYLT
jgi:signal transduction histidine kinase